MRNRIAALLLCLALMFGLSVGPASAAPATVQAASAGRCDPPWWLVSNGYSWAIYMWWSGCRY